LSAFGKLPPLFSQPYVAVPLAEHVTVMVTLSPRPAILKVHLRFPFAATFGPTPALMKWGLFANAPPGIVPKTNRHNVAIAALCRIVFPPPCSDFSRTLSAVIDMPRRDDTTHSLATPGSWGCAPRDP